MEEKPEFGDVTSNQEFDMGDDFKFGIKQEPELDLNGEEPPAEQEETQKTEDTSHCTIKQEPEGEEYEYDDNELHDDNIMEYQITFLPERPSDSHIFKCPHCSKEFSKKITLRNHIKRNHQTNKCPHCPRTFTYSGSLEKHVRTHEGDAEDNDGPNGQVDDSNSKGEEPKQIKCSECSKEFERLTDLIAHKKTHIGVIRYKCSQCPKEFARKDRYVAHLRLHAGEKAFQCPHCPKSLISMTNLKIHMRIHTGERPFKCSFCSKDFTQQASLDLHRRTHTGERPFKCSMCPAAFSQKINLQSHQRTHKSDVTVPMSTDLQ